MGNKVPGNYTIQSGLKPHLCANLKLMLKTLFVLAFLLFYSLLHPANSIASAHPSKHPSNISTSTITVPPAGSNNCQASTPNLVSLPFISVLVPNTSNLLCATNTSSTTIAPITITESGFSRSLSGNAEFLGSIKDANGDVLTIYSDDPNGQLYNPNNTNINLVGLIQDSSGNNKSIIADNTGSQLGQTAKYIFQHTVDFIGKYGSLNQIPISEIPTLATLTQPTTSASAQASTQASTQASSTTQVEQFYMPDPITNTCVKFVPTGDSLKDSLTAMTLDDCNKSLQPKCPPDKQCVGSAGVTCDPSTGIADNVPNPAHSGIYSVIGCIPTDPPTLVNSLLKFSASIAGGIALLLMVFGAIGMITSAGNEEAKKSAQQRFTSAVVGLMFILFSVVLLRIVGVDILNIPGFK